MVTTVRALRRKKERKKEMAFDVPSACLSGCIDVHLAAP
jgi:hypothetical protein